MLRPSAAHITLRIAESESGLTIGVMRAQGTKCDRCWYYSDSVGEDHEHSDICLRCADVIRKDGYKIEELPKEE